MRYLLVGLGNLGQRRRALLGKRCVAAVDPYNTGADHSTPEGCPLDAYDAAVLSVPNQAKLDLMEYFLIHGKHVLVDKPVLFEDEGRGERLAQRARVSGAVWYTSYNHRFEPLIVEMKRRLEAGEIGDLYHAHMLYGNGTVGNVVGSWREGGMGVVEDLGSHLLDLAAYLFGYQDQPFGACALNRHESSAYDQTVMRSADGRLVLEASYVCWKNSFAVEAFGRRGSLHLRGLRKWGPCELVARTRVLPSGVPIESRQDDAGPDETWVRDLAHFEERVTAGYSSYENDRWISRTLHAITATTPTHTGG